MRYLFQLDILILFLVTCSTTATHGTTRDVLLHQGDSAYIRKAFDSAVHFYELANKVNSEAITFLRLGNALYRLKHTALAVLAYENALKLDPNFKEASTNIAIIQHLLLPVANNDKLFFIRWWHRLVVPALSNGWAIASIFVFCTSLLGLTWSQYKGKPLSLLYARLTTGGVILGIIFLIISFSAAYHYSPSHMAVVMHPNASIRTESPFGKFVAWSLPEGMVVKVLRNGRERCLVSLPDGREGLIQLVDITLVE